MREPTEIAAIIERYPHKWRRWCDGPELGGCACMGCVRVPAPCTVHGDPEGQPFPNPNDRLTEEEVDAYQQNHPDGGPPDQLPELILTAVGPHRLKVISAIRKICDIPAKEAKAIVDSVPSTVLQTRRINPYLTDCPGPGIDRAKKKLEDAGASCDVKEEPSL